MVTVVFTEKNFDASLIPDTGTLYIIAASDTMVPIQIIEKVSAASMSGLRIMPIKYISGKCSEIGVAFKLGELASSIDDDIDIVGPKQLFADIIKDGFIGSDGKHHLFSIRTTQKKLSDKEPVKMTKKKKKTAVIKDIDEKDELFPADEITTSSLVNQEIPDTLFPVNKPVVDYPVEVEKHERKPRTTKAKVMAVKEEQNIQDATEFNLKEELEISPEIRKLMIESNVRDEEDILAVCSAIKQSTSLVSLSMCIRMRLSLIGRKDVKEEADRLSAAINSKYSEIKALL